jgi:hypothetical protein
MKAGWAEPFPFPSATYHSFPYRLRFRVRSAPSHACDFTLACAL